VPKFHDYEMTSITKEGQNLEIMGEKRGRVRRMY
jgi:hypothetical protein